MTLKGVTHRQHGSLLTERTTGDSPVGRDSDLVPARFDPRPPFQIGDNMPKIPKDKLPTKCLSCSAKWSKTFPYLARGLCKKCYTNIHRYGLLDNYPKLRQPPKPPKPRKVKTEATCISEGCTSTHLTHERFHDSFRCNPCRFAKQSYGVYDKTVSPRYDSTLPAKERVAHWLNPDNKAFYKGELTSFVKRGGPDGKCLIWQRRLKGSPKQAESHKDNPAKGLYPQVHFRDGSTSYSAQRAHRVVYAVTHDIPLAEVLVVDHRCGVRTCINPDHLGHETYASNTAGAIMGVRKDKEIAKLKKEIKELRNTIESLSSLERK